MDLKARLTELNYQEILYYLGYRSQGIDEKLDAQIKKCIKEIEKVSTPKLTYRIFNVDNGQITDFPLEGKDMKSLLTQACYAVVFGATIGNDVERILLRNEVMNMADALIMDAVASVAIENVCNNIEEDIRSYFKEKGLYVSSRFSPGYGDLPLDSQKQFCEMLNMSRQIGVNMTSSYLMTPRKSVTAILAVSDKPYTLRKSGCELCKLFMKCEYRKAGKYCEK